MSPRDEMTFWEHLEELRRVFIKIIVAIVGCGLVAFLLKDEVFRLILAPHAPDFLSYRLCEQLHLLSQNEITTTASAIQLVNTTLTGQFAMHVKAWHRPMCSISFSATLRPLSSPLRNNV